MRAVLSMIFQMKQITDSGVWWSLDREEVAQRLLEPIGPESSDIEGELDQAGRTMNPIT
jgi:hypothetical protein